MKVGPAVLWISPGVLNVISQLRYPHVDGAWGVSFLITEIKLPISLEVSEGTPKCSHRASLSLTLPEARFWEFFGVVFFFFWVGLLCSSLQFQMVIPSEEWRKLFADALVSHTLYRLALTSLKVQHCSVDWKCTLWIQVNSRLSLTGSFYTSYNWLNINQVTHNQICNTSCLTGVCDFKSAIFGNFWANHLRCIKK